MDWHDGSLWVQGDGCPPKVYGRSLFVVGPSRTVWDDWEACRWKEADVLTVNDIIAYLPEPVTYAVSLHWDRLLAWYAVRKLLYQDAKPVQLVSSHRRDGIDLAVRFLNDDLQVFNKSGSIESSGVYAMCLGLLLGYERIILVGCPGDGSGHLFHPPYRHFPGYADAGAKQAWEQAIRLHPEIAQRVRSCSGMTRDLLGDPLTWLSQLSARSPQS